VAVAGFASSELVAWTSLRCRPKQGSRFDSRQQPSPNTVPHQTNHPIEVFLAWRRIPREPAGDLCRSATGGTTRMAVAQLAMVSLDARDLERTYCFYAAFGAELRWKSLPSGDRRLLIETGGVLLEFCEGDRYGKEPWVTIEFLVDSVNHCFVALQQEGYNP